MLKTGMQKAAALLMSLEPDEAGRLLEGFDAQVVKELAAEMAEIEDAGECTEETFNAVRREMLTNIHGHKNTNARVFMEELFKAALGTDGVAEAVENVHELLFKRDPFRELRDCPAMLLNEALRGESPQVYAIVLGELPPDRSAQLLGMLDPECRAMAIRGMAGGDEASREARVRVARMIVRKVDELRDVVEDSDDGLTPYERKLRKVALLLRGLEPAERETMMKGIVAEDKSVSDKIDALMVMWEDVPHIADRALQEVLRSVNSKKLALALVNTDAETVEKIRSNMSERASNMLDEEAQLLSSPGQSEIKAAREDVLDALRNLNKTGELTFTD